MIYFECKFKNAAAASVFKSFGHEVLGDDNGYNAKINVTEPEEFKKLISYLKLRKREDINEIFHNFCHSFKSDGEEIPSGLENELSMLVKKLPRLE